MRSQLNPVGTGMIDTTSSDPLVVHYCLTVKRLANQQNEIAAAQMYRDFRQ
jgi:hypothetical protein